MPRLLFILIFLLLFPIFLIGQSGVLELKGRLVGIQNGKKVGMANVKVHAGRYDEDKTDERGFFSLVIPKQAAHVELEIEHSSIFPSRLMMPPPYENIEFLGYDPNTNRIAGACAKRIKAEIQKSRANQRLSERKILELQKAMIDTVLYYESVIHRDQITINNLREKVSKAESENSELKNQLLDQERRILELERKVERLTLELHFAKEELFRNQEKAFRQITHGLHNYTDRLKDFRDWIEHIEDFYYPAPSPAQGEFRQKVEKYNNARNDIANKHQNNLELTENYWKNRKTLYELEDTYEFLLKDLNDKFLDSYQTHIQGPAGIKNVTSKKAAKIAAEGSEILLAELNPKIEKLEKMIESVEEKLKSEM